MKTLIQKDIVGKIKSSEIIPLFYHDDPEICISVLKACYEGGLRAFEFTNRGANAVDNFRRLSEYAKSNCPEMTLGIGTILDISTTSVFIAMGAEFIVSPIMSEELINFCKLQQVLCLPGCFSPTEIHKAMELGVEIVKLFPAEQLGPKFIASLKAPMPNCNIMPSGGVELSEDNLRAWFKAGAFCVGIGSNLITKEILQVKDYQLLTNKIIEAKLIIQKIR